MNEEFDMKEFWDFTSDSIGELRRELQVKQEESETTMRRLHEEIRQLREDIG